ncbi:dipeptide/oligopeptide/nickel ABC transporter permease/ATP-binding protein [Rhodococcus sp. T2V]|uniref:dipeptide/oligopeptide/nickel ABC transporter permease/ATP-binding protein n=1 Tax=Rhodococcus sp. T2V TaxID=3034164 RepID=UPI0023E2EF8E|nr:dipeptide/oligopeptide/nickel ABC transporter permease/ATP-binding protein [Rhodococcus sp. T2V]MDF3311878.1 dipeptide/oligopeptide/nickel ABC transporter permease/ATP-binding protein [Rhodococcus sp. T2V]
MTSKVGGSSVLGQMARRYRRDRSAMAWTVILVLIILACVFGGLIAPYDPDAQLSIGPFSGLSSTHWLGTDDLGRDVLSRILVGGRVSLTFSFLVVLSAMVLALPVGLIAGYVGGRLDAVVMRVMDGLLSLPALVLAIAIVSMLGPNLRNAGVAMAITLLPGFTRLVRGQALAVREEVFIDASHALGAPTRLIVWRHLLPNVASPLIVQVSLSLGFAVLMEAGLSFLGLGVQPPTASWGTMLSRANESMLTQPWSMMAPGLAIVLTVVAFNEVGEGLRSALGASTPPKRSAQLGLTTVQRASHSTTAVADEQIRREKEPLLRVEGLAIEMGSGTDRTQILDNVSFSIGEGEALGLVGESGSGKTVTSLSIMRLLPSPPARVIGGSINFEGRDLLSLNFDEMSALRSSGIAMIFQDPMSSLNPAMTVGDQISQVVRWHENISSREASVRMRETLELVGIPPRRADSYPHEFSGGMRQRAMIAMALVCRPKLLIADEPTTALDVTVQAQILELLRELRSELKMSILFVSHDLGVVADICDRIAVMYAGQIVEEGSVSDVFRAPSHPYTRGLLRAMPEGAAPRSPLFVIPGQVPQFSELAGGCRFASRCEFAGPECQVDVPLVTAAPNRSSRCVRTKEVMRMDAR